MHHTNHTRTRTLHAQVHKGQLEAALQAERQRVSEWYARMGAPSAPSAAFTPSPSPVKAVRDPGERAYARTYAHSLTHSHTRPHTHKTCMLAHTDSTRAGSAGAEM